MACAYLAAVDTSEMARELLHSFQVAGGPRDACRGCVTVVVKSVVQQPCVKLGTSPFGFESLTGHRVALPRRSVVPPLLGNIGKHEFGVVALQREKQFPNAGRYRNGA